MRAFIFLTAIFLTACNSDGGQNFIGGDGMSSPSEDLIILTNPDLMEDGIGIKGISEDGEVFSELWGVKYPEDEYCVEEAKQCLLDLFEGRHSVYFEEKSSNLGHFYFDEDGDRSINERVVSNGCGLSDKRIMDGLELDADEGNEGLWKYCRNEMEEESERYR